MLIFSWHSAVTSVMDSQESGLIATVLLSTHNLSFDLEIKKYFWLGTPNLWLLYCKIDSS